MNSITLLAHVNAFTGYGLHAIEIARGLEFYAGIQVKIRAITRSELRCPIPDDIKQKIDTEPQDGPWELLLHPPNNFAPTPRKRTIWYTMCENTADIGAKALKHLNSAELIIVPSCFSAAVMSARGVTRPIAVVPLGIDTDLFNQKPSPAKPHFVFATAGTGHRKGLQEVIDCYQESFPERTDVVLKIKCMPEDRLKCADPRIEVTNRYLSPAELVDWFAGIDCYINASHGEGFGLMPLQAMAIGRPVWTHKYGGIMEYWDNYCGYSIPYHVHNGWGKIEPDSLIDAMKRLTLASAFQNGQHAAKVARHFSWEKSIGRLIDVLEVAGVVERKKLPPAPELVMPKTPEPAKPADVPKRPAVIHMPKSRLNLKQVTLWACCWSSDENNLNRTIRVLDYCNRIARFHDIVIFSYLPVPWSKLDRIQIPKLADFDAFNIWVNKTLPKFLDRAPFSMSIHEDGFPIRPDLWRKEFLHYDYIGAPWKNGTVGNGGFSIESRDLIKAKQELPFYHELRNSPDGRKVLASDVFLCIEHRSILDSMGINFAPQEVAAGFSAEQLGRKFPSFGFHGRRDQPEKYAEGWALIEAMEETL